MLGMLLSGLILRNAAPGLVATLPSSWSKGLRTFALGMIFLRSGLELDIRIFKRVGPAATRLLLVPGLTEAFVTGAISTKLLGLPLFYGARASRSAFRLDRCCTAAAAQSACRPPHAWRQRSAPTTRRHHAPRLSDAPRAGSPLSPPTPAYSKRRPDAGLHPEGRRPRHRHPDHV